MSGSDLPTNSSFESPAIVDLDVVAAIIARDGLILAAKRLPGGGASEKWEFPGGKVESGETAEAALIREIQEELGLVITVESDLGTFITVQGSFRINLQCFICTSNGTGVQLNAHSAIRWCSVGQLQDVDWANADIPVVQAILLSKLTLPQ